MRKSQKPAVLANNPRCLRIASKTPLCDFPAPRQYATTFKGDGGKKARIYSVPKNQLYQRYYIDYYSPFSPASSSCQNGKVWHVDIVDFSGSLATVEISRCTGIWKNPHKVHRHVIATATIQMDSKVRIGASPPKIENVDK